MKFTLVCLLLFAANILIAAPPLTPQPPPPECKLELGRSVIRVPVATTPEQRAMGLMNRTSLGPDEGMLFVFDSPQKVAFWMKNTFVPLSIAYINPTGTILEIYDMKPLNEEPIVSCSIFILYALEMPQGWFERHGIRPGTLIKGLKPTAKTAITGKTDRTPSQIGSGLKSDPDGVARSFSEHF